MAFAATEEGELVLRQVLVDAIYMYANEGEKIIVEEKFGANGVSILGQDLFDNCFDDFNSAYHGIIEACLTHLTPCILHSNDEELLSDWNSVKSYLSHRENAENAVHVCSLSDPEGNRVMSLNAYELTLLLFTAQLCLQLYRTSVNNPTQSEDRVNALCSTFAHGIWEIVADKRLTISNNSQALIKAANCIFMAASVTMFFAIAKKMFFI